MPLFALGITCDTGLIHPVKAQGGSRTTSRQLIQIAGLAESSVCGQVLGGLTRLTQVYCRCEELGRRLSAGSTPTVMAKMIREVGRVAAEPNFQPRLNTASTLPLARWVYHEVNRTKHFRSWATGISKGEDFA